MYWAAGAPTLRCEVVQLHPLDFAIQFFTEHYSCTESDPQTP